MAIDFIVIHCSTTPPHMDIGAEIIRGWHTMPKPDGRGWRDIGYNYVGPRDGSLEVGRDEGEELAHARGFNRNAIAYCLVGGVDAQKNPEANFTKAQRERLSKWLVYAQLRYPDAEIVGHRDLPFVNKDCPSFDVAYFLETGEMINPRKQ